MQFQTMKARSRELCRTTRPNLIVLGAIYYALGTLVNTLSTRLLSSGISETQAERYLDAYMAGNLERCLSIAEKCAPSGAAVGIDAALRILMSIVAFGVTIFFLNTLRDGSQVYGNLLDGFGQAGNVILLTIAEDALVFLGSVFLVVPGIVLALRYSMAKYLLADHPEMNAIACMRESARMMKGHKWEFFRLNLSMLGWTLAGAFIPLAAVWTVPYTGTVCAQYYRQLAGLDEEAVFQA